MNKVFSSILLFAVILSSVAVASAAPVQVSIGNVDCDPGKTVAVPIMLSGIQNYGAGTITIKYDPAVVHVTDVVKSSDSKIADDNIDNTAGLTGIAAWNIGGVSGDIVFANVNFTAVGTGSTTLNLIVDTLQDTEYTELPVTLENGSISIASSQPGKPFVISGYVSYEGGAPCNTPGVTITNQNTGNEWQAETGNSGNYYRLTLSAPGDVTSGDVLHFAATCGSDSGTVDHTISAVDVDSGGLFKFNLTIPQQGDPSPYLVACTISNASISPNGDGIKDDAEIDVEFSESVAAAITIGDVTGTVKTLYTGLDVTNPDPQVWDGTDGDGNTVACGTYQVNITMDDGVNPMVCDTTHSIKVTDGTTVAVTIADTTANLGDAVTLPIMLGGIADYGAGTIKLTYNPTVVYVTEVTDGSDSEILAHTINNTVGVVNISAMNTDGVSGDVTFANVVFDAVGVGSTQLTITVDKLKDIAYNSLPVTTSEGLFTVQSSTNPAPTLDIYEISNSIISPNGDGVMDDTTIDVKFSESVAATITIENATGVVKALYTGAGVTDPDPQVWDGTDDSISTVAYGTYHVKVTMDDGVNPVVIDNTKSIIVADTSVAIISIGDGVGNVTLPIKIENGVDVGACDITLTFDPDVVNVTKVENGDMDVTVANLEHAHEGLVRIGTYQSSNPGLSGTITFANVVLEPVNGGNCSLNLSVVTYKDATPVGNQMPYIVRNGTYTGGVTLNGDVNGDGMVDMHDAMYLAKYLLSKDGFETIDKEAADVNGDGKITTHDAMYIAKHVIGASGYEVLK